MHVGWLGIKKNNIHVFNICHLLRQSDDPRIFTCFSDYCFFVQSQTSDVVCSRGRTTLSRTHKLLTGTQLSHGDAQFTYGDNPFTRKSLNPSSLCSRVSYLLVVASWYTYKTVDILYDHLTLLYLSVPGASKKAGYNKLSGGDETCTDLNLNLTKTSTHHPESESSSASDPELEEDEFSEDSEYGENK